MVWIDCAKWRERWEPVKTLIGGGQGEAFQARRKDDGTVAFLKSIKAKKDRERRARFFREATAYDTFRVHNVPHLIESNAHRHADAEIEPYIATEFIEGPTLREWREAQPRCELSVAFEIIRSLLTTLSECHAAGCVHRDIKPDNIILAGGDPARPFLLDFGLSFHNTEPDHSFQTEHGQELGNRFLRLPELSAGSSLKQDERSDLSFAAGILLYVLTGQHPDVLHDAEGRLPHQRSSLLATLQNVGGHRFSRLASLFDTAFAPQLAHRFTNASSMLTTVDRITETRRSESSPEEDLAAIFELINFDAEQRLAEKKKKLREAVIEVEHAHDEVRSSLKGAFEFSYSERRFENEFEAVTIFWNKRGSDERVMATKCEARVEGDEITVQFSDETLFRTPLSFPKYGVEFRKVASPWLIRRLRETLDDPDALPPEVENFVEFKPLGKLSEAIEEARRSGRRILAFVYDPAQKERGRLQHCLGYFLQNRKTRETIHSVFVVALVPLSQVLGKSKALEGLSMETSRWVIFDSDLTPLDQAVIYANPQEGEKIAIRLAQKFGAPDARRIDGPKGA